MEKVRICLCGTGWTAGNHFAGYSAIKEKAEVVAVVTRSDEGRARAKEWNAPRIYRNFEDALRDAEVDAVDLCLPHSLHAPFILEALDAGKHVMVETPTCITLDECRQLRHALREHPGQVAATGHIVRHWQTYHHAKQIVALGEIGNVFHVHSDYAHKPDPNEYPSHITWGRNPTMTGRLSISYHSVDLLRWMVDSDVDEVFGEYTDHSRAAILRFKNGALGEVFTSGAVVQPYSLGLEVHGHEGTIHCFWHEQTLKGFLHRSAEWQPTTLKETPLHGRGSPEWTWEMENFVDAIRGAAQPICPMLDGVATVETCLAVDLAMTTRSVIRVRQ